MIRIVLCAFALSCSATVALACNGLSKQTQSCAPGSYWDAESGGCTKIVNS